MCVCVCVCVCVCACGALGNECMAYPAFPQACPFPVTSSGEDLGRSLVRSHVAGIRVGTSATESGGEFAGTAAK